MKNQARSERLENKLNGWTENMADLLYASAVKLARKGKYLHAERILSLIATQARPSTRIPLLRGKIYAQQSRYNDAISEWREVLKIEPKNSEASTAIKRAEQQMKLKILKESLP